MTLWRTSQVLELVRTVCDEDMVFYCDPVVSTKNVIITHAYGKNYPWHFFASITFFYMRPETRKSMEMLFGKMECSTNT